MIMFLLLLFRITNTFSEGKKFHITMKPSSRMSGKKNEIQIAVSMFLTGYHFGLGTFIGQKFLLSFFRYFSIFCI